VFKDPNALSLFDEEHSDEEERWITLGLDETGVLLVISHTFNAAENQARVRLVSVRKATKNEKKQYLRK
jgi:uncharacterized DUF497 family protein